MPFKACPICGQRSYSACSGQIWICPCCGEDLSATAELVMRRTSVLAMLRQETAGRDAAVAGKSSGEAARDVGAVREEAVSPQLVLLQNEVCS